MRWFGKSFISRNILEGSTISADISIYSLQYITGISPITSQTVCRKTKYRFFFIEEYIFTSIYHYL